MSDNSTEEKTEKPTPKKLRDAKEKGNVVRTRELGVALQLIISACFITVFGFEFITDLSTSMKMLLSFDYNAVRSSNDMFDLAVAAFSAPFKLVVELGVVSCIVAYVGQTMLGGHVFKFSKVMPKMSNINPISGIGRIFSGKTVFELLKTILKMLLVGITCYVLLPNKLEALIPLLSDTYLPHVLSDLGNMVAKSAIIFGSVLLIVSFLDAPYQKFSHIKKLKMSRKDMKDEYKNSEGSPEVKSRVRQIMYENAAKGPVSAAADATVVVTNPTHYAVAIKYVDGQMDAPKILCSGKNMSAMEIRSIATAARVPVLEIPPLARSLYVFGKDGADVPYDLFVPVAKVLAYISSLDNQLAYSVDSDFIGDYDIPEHLRVPPDPTIDVRA